MNEMGKSMKSKRLNNYDYNLDIGSRHKKKTYRKHSNNNNNNNK